MLSEAMVETNASLLLMTASHSNLVSQVMDKRSFFPPPNGLASVPVDGSRAPTPITGPLDAAASADGKLLAYCKGKYSPDRRIYVVSGDSERLLTPNVGGCYRPVFSHKGDRLFFLQEEWPDGFTGTAKFSIWETRIDGTETRELVDCRMLHNPLTWKVRKTE